MAALVEQCLGMKRCYLLGKKSAITKQVALSLHSGSNAYCGSSAHHSVTWDIIGYPSYIVFHYALASKQMVKYFRHQVLSGRLGSWDYMKR